METNPMQLFVFRQSLIWKIRNPSMEIARNAPTFRNQWKTARGIPKGASALVVLKDLRDFWVEQKNAKELEKFDEHVAKYNIILPE